MKESCQHPNIKIIEFASATTWHQRTRNGWVHDSDFDDYTGRIEVECEDCGLRRTYYARRPKWVQELFESIAQAEEQTA